MPEMPSPDRGDDGERRGRSYGQTSSVQERSTDYSYWRERERDGGARPERELGDGWTAALSASAHHLPVRSLSDSVSLSLCAQSAPHGCRGSLVFSYCKATRRSAEGRTVLLGSWPRAAGWDWTGAVTHYFTDHLSTQLSSWYIF